MTITFTNAVVEDDGYGVEVNGRSLEAIISTVLRSQPLCIMQGRE